MKKVFRMIPAAIVMMSALSCAKQEAEPEKPTPVEMKPMVFSVGGEPVKTYIDGNNVCWKTTDLVAVFDGVNPDANRFEVSDIDGTNAVLRGEVAASSSSYHAVCPYSQALSGGEGVVTISFPSDQPLEGQNVASVALVSIGASTGETMMMKNFFSRVRFTTGKSFLSATLMGLNGEALAGTVDVDMTDMTWSGLKDERSYVTMSDAQPLAPGTYEFTVLPDVVLKGFVLKIVDVQGVTWMAQSGKDLVLERNSGQDLKNIDGRLTRVTIHTQDQMNVASHWTDSHAGAEKRSSLEMVYDSYQVIPNSSLVPSDSYDDGGSLAPNIDRATYPRLKKMADGRYIMFCEGGMTPYEQFYSISLDLKTWSEPEYLYKTTTRKVTEGTYRIRYMSTDAAVLPDGKIIAVTASRARNAFAYNLGYDCGILMKTSRDNAASWSSAKMIYEGYCWEPYPLVLPDGTIQVYFTDVQLLDSDGDGEPDDNNSGTSMIESKDDGVTWSEKKRISQQYKFQGKDMAGNTVNVYTDQMPCFRVLNDGKTILGFLEASVMETGAAAETMKMSVVRNSSLEWTALPDNAQTGPSGRLTNICSGTGGYLCTFPSGEVLLSCSRGQHSMKIGNHDGTEFYGGWDGAYLDTDWYQPFDVKGNWGSVEAIDGHHAVSLIRQNEEPYAGVMFAQFVLNHDIHAENSPVTLDGNPSEWQRTEALFVGSDSDAQAIMRASFHEGKLYLLVETVNASDVSVRITLGTAADITVDGNGLVEGPSGAAAVASSGSTADGRTGYACEISLPVEELPLPVNISLSNGDGFSLYAPEDMTTWPQIRYPLEGLDGVGLDDVEESVLEEGFWNQ